MTKDEIKELNKIFYEHKKQLLSLDSAVKNVIDSLTAIIGSNMIDIEMEQLRQKVSAALDSLKKLKGANS